MLIKQGKTNWWYILFVIVLATIVGIGVFYQWQALKEGTKISGGEMPKKVTEISEEEKEMVEEVIEDKTANWKIYQNSKIGFLMKYPSGAELVMENIEGGPFAVASFHYLDDFDYSSGFFVIRNFNYDEKLGGAVTIEELREKVLPAILGAEVKQQKEERIFINNIPAIKLSYFSELEGQSYLVSALIIDKYIFVIGCFSQREWCKDNFDLMLSTVELAEVMPCVNSRECGVCHMCDMGGVCGAVSTNWGDGLYGCSAGEGQEQRRCYQGICKTCEGLLRYDPGAKKAGCWYLGIPATSCENFCGEKGCVGAHWTDDGMCSIGRSLTGCSNCSTNYEDGWWVPYYDVITDTCYHHLGAGTYYACHWGPDLATFRRMCACNY